MAAKYSFQKLSDEDKEKIKTLYEGGYQVACIASRFGISKQTVKKVAKDLGADSKQRGVPQYVVDKANIDSKTTEVCRAVGTTAIRDREWR